MDGEGSVPIFKILRVNSHCDNVLTSSIERWKATVHQGKHYLKKNTTCSKAIMEVAVLTNSSYGKHCILTEATWRNCCNVVNVALPSYLQNTKDVECVVQIKRHTAPCPRKAELSFGTMFGSHDDPQTSRHLGRACVLVWTGKAFSIEDPMAVGRDDICGGSRLGQPSEHAPCYATPPSNCGHR